MLPAGSTATIPSAPPPGRRRAALGHEPVADEVEPGKQWPHRPERACQSRSSAAVVVPGRAPGAEVGTHAGSATRLLLLAGGAGREHRRQRRQQRPDRAMISAGRGHGAAERATGQGADRAGATR